MVELELNGKKVTGPVWVLVGHPDNSVTVTLGYGRKRAGRVGTAQGFDAYPLRTSAAPWFATGLQIRKTGDNMCLPRPKATSGWTRPTAIIVRWSVRHA